MKSNEKEAHSICLRKQMKQHSEGGMRDIYGDRRISELSIQSFGFTVEKFDHSTWNFGFTQIIRWCDECDALATEEKCEESKRRREPEIVLGKNEIGVNDLVCPCLFNMTGHFVCWCTFKNWKSTSAPEKYTHCEGEKMCVLGYKLHDNGSQAHSKNTHT